MYHPELDAIRAMAKWGNLAPVYREIPADMETPVTAYLKVAREGPSFLLESVEGGERLARYSFIGTLPYQVLQTGPETPAGSVDPLLQIQAALGHLRPVAVEGLPRFLGGAVGYIAYDAVRHFEPRVPANAASDPMGLPESVFMLTNTLLIFDHLKHVIKVVSHATLDGDIEHSYQEATERIDRLVDRLETGTT